jgi:hypothetical protein
MSFVLIIGKLLRKYCLKISIKLEKSTQKILKETIIILGQETEEQYEKPQVFRKS